MRKRNKNDVNRTEDLASNSLIISHDKPIFNKPEDEDCHKSTPLQNSESKMHSDFPNSYFQNFRRQSISRTQQPYRHGIIKGVRTKQQLLSNSLDSPQPSSSTVKNVSQDQPKEIFQPDTLFSKAYNLANQDKLSEYPSNTASRDDLTLINNNLNKNEINDNNKFAPEAFLNINKQTVTTSIVSEEKNLPPVFFPLNILESNRPSSFDDLYSSDEIFRPLTNNFKEKKDLDNQIPISRFDSHSKCESCISSPILVTDPDNQKFENTLSLVNNSSNQTPSQALHHKCTEVSTDNQICTSLSNTIHPKSSSNHLDKILPSLNLQKSSSPSFFPEITQFCQSCEPSLNPQRNTIIQTSDDNKRNVIDSLKDKNYTSSILANQKSIQPKIDDVISISLQHSQNLNTIPTLTGTNDSICHASSIPMVSSLNPSLSLSKNFDCPINQVVSTDKIFIPNNAKESVVLPSTENEKSSVIMETPQNIYCNTHLPQTTSHVQDINYVSEKLRSINFNSEKNSFRLSSPYECQPHPTNEYQIYVNNNMAAPNAPPNMYSSHGFNTPYRLPLYPNQYYPQGSYQGYYPDYNAIAYAKWREDYARWYNTYQQVSSLQKSVKYSGRSSVNLNYGKEKFFDTLSTIHTVNRFSRDSLAEQDESIHPLQDSRSTPFLRTSFSSFSNFAPDGTLVVCSSNHSSIYSLSNLNRVNDVEFPGPLTKSSNTRILSNYIRMTIETLPQGCIKLLWELFCVFIQDDASKDLFNLCEPLIKYSRDNSQSFPLLPPTNQLSNDAHSRISNALLNNDLRSAVFLSIENASWPLAFALSSTDEILLSTTLKKFTNTLDSRSLIRTFLSLRLNLPIEIGSISDSALDATWSLQVAMILSQISDKTQLVSTLFQILNALQARNKSEPALIVSVILDLALGAHQCDQMLWPNHSLKDIFSNPNTFDLFHFRTVEIFEKIKIDSQSSFISPFIQIYKTIYAEIISEYNKDRAFEYTEKIGQIVSNDTLSLYPHGYLTRFCSFSRRLYSTLFPFKKFPTWLNKLNKAILSYPNQPVEDDFKDTDLSNEQNQFAHSIPLIKPQEAPHEHSHILYQPPPLISQELIPTIQPPQSNFPMEKTLPLSQPQPEFFVPSLKIVENQDTRESIYLSNNSLTCDSASQIPNTHQTVSFSDHQLRNNISSKPPSVSSISEPPESNSKPLPLADKNLPPKEVDKPNPVPPSQNKTLFSNIGKVFNVFRSREQIYLPDDSNPSIVFDETIGSYVDKSNQNSSTKISQPPPPKTIIAVGDNSNVEQSVRGPSTRTTSQLYITPKY